MTRISDRMGVTRLIASTEAGIQALTLSQKPMISRERDLGNEETWAIKNSGSKEG